MNPLSVSSDVASRLVSTKQLPKCQVVNDSDSQTYRKKEQTSLEAISHGPVVLQGKNITFRIISCIEILLYKSLFYINTHSNPPNSHSS
jgi:hypothetical protein